MNPKPLLVVTFGVQMTPILIRAKSYDDLNKQGLDELKVQGSIETPIFKKDQNSNQVVRLERSNGFAELPCWSTLIFVPKKVRNSYKKIVAKVKNSESYKDILANIKTSEEGGARCSPSDLGLGACILFILQESQPKHQDAENKEDHKEWFTGPGVLFETKSSFMDHLIMKRLKGYHSETSKKLSTMRKEFDDAMKGFLRDREKELPCIPRRDVLHCAGPFGEENCKSKHSINPFESHGARLLFDLWELDHQTEQNYVRQILKEAITAREGRQINFDVAFRKLCGKENLKLVHTLCHSTDSRPQHNAASLRLEDFYLGPIAQSSHWKCTKPYSPCRRASVHSNENL